MFDRLSIEKKNKIGLIGFLVLILGGASYAAYDYWPARWSSAGRLANSDINALTPDQLKQKLAAVDLSKMSMEDRMRLAEKAGAYMSNLSGDERRALWSGDGAANRNFRELMETERMKEIDAYFKADAEEKLKILDRAIDRMRDLMAERQARAATQPGGGGGGWGGGNPGGQNGGPRGPGGGGPGGPGGNRTPAGRLNGMANRLAAGDPDQCAAAAQFAQAMQQRAAQRGVPMPRYGGR